MNFIICDNSMRDRAALIRLLAQYINTQNGQADYVECNSGENLLLYLHTHTADLIFIDIYMEQLNGIDTAIQLRKESYQGGLIFISASGDYAVESYRVQADYYLMKPFSYIDVVNALSAYIVKNAEKAQELSPILHIICDHKTVEIPTLEITYIEVYNRMLTIHCCNRNYDTYGTLDAMIVMLDPASFIRVHRSYIVNMHFIRDMQKNRLILKNDLDISISRHLNKQIHSAYQDFLDHILWEEA